MEQRNYRSPEAFRQSLEQRVRTAAGPAGMGRFRQVLVFDRFLARLFSHFGERAIVKGGVVLELRLERARSTRDVDIRLSGTGDNLLTELQRAGIVDLQDFLAFTIERDRDHPTIEGDGVIYGGQRFRVQARLAGKVYAGAFGLDVGFGDILTEAPETIDGSNFHDSLVRLARGIAFIRELSTLPRAARVHSAPAQRELAGEGSSRFGPPRPSWTARSRKPVQGIGSHI